MQEVNVKNTKAVYLGTKKPHFKGTDPASLRSKSKEGKKKSLPPNFFGRGKNKVVRPELEHQGPDPIRQSMMKTLGTSVEPVLNFEGISSSWGSPNDPSGAAGISHYVMAVNATTIGVYDRIGNLLNTFDGNSLWSSMGYISGGDPIVLYDAEKGQWIITEFAPYGDNMLLVAVSENSDPLGSYHSYAFATPEFPDYPKYGIWKDVVVVTTNEQGPTSLHQYFIDREALMSGSEEVTIQRVEIVGNGSTETGFYTSTPVNWGAGPPPADSKPMVVKINDSSWGEVSNDMVEVFTFDVDFADPNNTTVSKTEIVTAPFDGYPCSTTGEGFECVPQKGGGGLDAIPEVVMNVPQYRRYDSYEAIVLSFITDVTNGENLSGIRWVELRKKEDWELHQEGTFAPDDGKDRFMPSIALDGVGNIGLAYNVTSDDDYVGLSFTGRFASDPLGYMTVIEHEVVSGSSTINSFGRFGDYAHMSIDPADDRTFWHTSEYAGSENSGVRAFSFVLQRLNNDLSVSDIVSPTTGSELTGFEPVTVRITNTGLQSASGFDLTLSLDGSPLGTLTVSDELIPENSKDYVFDNQLDLSSFGEYDIGVSLSYDRDESNANNTFSKKVKHLADLDASLVIGSDNQACVGSVEINLEITNEGTTELIVAAIDLYLNNSFAETIPYNGFLLTGQSEKFSYLVEGLMDGENDIMAILRSPNGSTDQVADNNQSMVSVLYDNEFSHTVLSIKTDYYPGETTWRISDWEGNEITNGGPYQSESTVYLESFCVDPKSCYIFEIFDSAGDGICCDYGEGSYSLSSSGSVLFDGFGEFEDYEQKKFCLGEACNSMEVTIEKLDKTEQELGYTLLINANGGGSSYSYSIDGGVTMNECGVFYNLEEGEYNIYVVSDFSCNYREFINIEPSVLNLEGGLVDQNLMIFPNPSNGIFRITLEGRPEVKGFLELEILDISGSIVKRQMISRYGDIFEGSISLYDQPKGVYLIRTVNIESDEIIKVVIE